MIGSSWGHRVGAYVHGAFVALFLTLGLLAAPAGASADPQYSVMNAPEGVYWRSEPNWSAAERIAGFGVYDGTIVEVHCYQSGTTVEGSADTMWEQATDVGGSGYGSGWLNEHFIDDGQPIDQPSPGVGPCGGAAASAPAAAPPASSGGSSTAPPATTTPSSPPPPKPTCYGDYCSGKNPTKAHCASGATVIATVKGPEDPAALELLWSATCKTKWARLFVSGWSAPAELGAEQSTGYRQWVGVGGHFGKNTEMVSPMIYSPKKCVRAYYLPAPGYEWDLTQTACK